MCLTSATKGPGTLLGKGVVLACKSESSKSGRHVVVVPATKAIKSLSGVRDVWDDHVRRVPVGAVSYVYGRPWS